MKRAKFLFFGSKRANLATLVTCGKTLIPVPRSEPLLLRYCNEMNANFRTICSQVSQPASAGNVIDMSELQAQKCMTPQ